MTRTTKQVLDADPEMGWMIDHLPNEVLWRQHEDSTEDNPIVTVVEVIVGKFVDANPT